MADQEQWVNIEPKADLVEDEVASIERLGAGVKFKAKFKKATLANFKVRVVPLGSQASYTKGEKGRNKSFKLRRLGNATKNLGKEVELSRELALPCGGGNRFQIEAKYKGKVVTGKTILAARRRFFFQVLSMKGIAPHSVSGMEDYFWSPGKNFYVKLKEKGGRGEIALVKTIHENHDEFLKAAKAGYKLEARRPHSFTLVFSNFIASKATYDLALDLDVTVPSSIVAIVKGGERVQVTLPQYLWWGMDPSDDAKRGFLVANATRFVATDGTSIPIPDDDISVAGPPEFPLGGYKKLEFNLGRRVQKARSATKGKLRMNVRLQTVGGWTNGFSYNGINLITVANNVRWKPMPANTREYTLNHEFGHKIGMVAAGKAVAAGAASPYPQFLPQGPPTLYGDQRGVNDRNHQGPHCSKGATWNAATATWTGAPACVMFGANGIYSGATLHHAPKEFCPECEKIVRKLDLAPGHLGGFRASVMD